MNSYGAITYQMRSGKNDVCIRIHLHVKFQDILAEQIAFGNRDTAVRKVT
jgi:hypothetical protein